ncbi:sensor histidine kinase [Microbulbifer agarilyticus]|uniref:sensor histidine kinase n=1 Tax=Microbulbifer agarilyticus TaxID=260552 RepID=UPI001CD224F5|nr:HAMP domain-containing sensor histidine kinase [Microbulbifer agarilyticus]MCA0899722.1 HAMP domain-containing histidine kinase [Microbulbifer agarilyticus]
MQAETPRSNLQRKVFTLFGGFTLLLCLIYSGIGLLTAYVIEDQLLDNLINEEARYIEQSLHDDGTLPSPRLPMFTLYTSPADTPPEFLTALAGEQRRAEYFVEGRQHFHLRELSPDTSAILAAEVGNLLTVSSQSGRLIWLPLAAFLLTTVLALWLAYRLVTSAIRPILNLAREVELQATNQSPLALSTSSRHDEIGFLARTLQRNMHELKQARQREAEFTHDVSHELRTNLAIASNTLALARNQGLGVEESRELSDILATMNRTVSTLLALARSESFEHSSFDLRPLVEERLLARREIVMHPDFQLDVKLPDTLPVVGHPHLAASLLDILFDNAIQHASQPALEIRHEDGALIFENPVLKEFSTASLFNAGTRGPNSEGFGQGLYLASRIFSALGWRFSSTCENGRFSLSAIPVSDNADR